MADNPLAQALFHGSGQPYWGGANSMVTDATVGYTGLVAAAPAAPAIAATSTSIAAQGFGWYYGLTGGSGVVLGSYAAEGREMNYVQAGEAIGANFLNALKGVYNFFQGAGQWWTLNQAFLSSSIARGQQFYLSSEPMGTGGFLQKMQYLQGGGIDPYSLPWVWTS